jgi:hypothetical protein
MENLFQLLPLFELLTSYERGLVRSLGSLITLRACLQKYLVGPPPDDTLALTASDVNCTEPWLTLHLGSGFASYTAQFTRNISVVASMTLIGTDTTIEDTVSLAPHTCTPSLPGAASLN